MLSYGHAISSPHPDAIIPARLLQSNGRRESAEGDAGGAAAAASSAQGRSAPSLEATTGRGYRDGDVAQLRRSARVGRSAEPERPPASAVSRVVLAGMVVEQAPASTLPHVPGQQRNHLGRDGWHGQRRTGGLESVLAEGAVREDRNGVARLQPRHACVPNTQRRLEPTEYGTGPPWSKARKTWSKIRLSARVAANVTRRGAELGAGAGGALGSHDGNGQSRQVHPPKTPRAPKCGAPPPNGFNITG
jgi:hypothetical protein